MKKCGAARESSVADDRYYNDLLLAIRSGDVKLVKTLLKLKELPSGSKLEAVVNKPHDESGVVPLHVAARNGHAEAVTALLAVPGVKINTRTKKGVTPLFAAAHNGHVEVVRVLLAKERVILVNMPDEQNMTPLYAAAHNGHVEVVKLLVEAGADFNSTAQVVSPLYAASQNGHVEVVRVLLANVGVVNKSHDESGVVPLHVAAWNGHAAIVDMLLGVPGVKINTRTKKGITPLFTAAQNGHVEVVRVLLAKERVILVNMPNEQNMTPLYAAAQNGHAAIVEVLLRVPGVDVNKTNSQGYAPLYAAAYEGHVEVVKFLVEAGADFNPTAEVASPLHAASQNGYVEVVRVLLANVGVVNISDDAYAEPLYAAAKNDHAAIVEALLRVPGVDVNKTNSQGYTPLYVAAYKGHVEVVKLLVEAGADFNPTAEVASPLHAASQNGHVEVVRVLLANVGVVNISDDAYAEPLYAAAGNGHVAIVEAFLSVPGVDVNKTSSEGFTPLHVAAYEGHVEVVRLLVEAGADLNLGTKEALSPLFAAVVEGRTEVVAILIEAGVKVNTRLRGKTPLHIAISCRQEEIVGLLLDAPGFDIEEEAKRSKYALLHFVSRAQNLTPGIIAGMNKVMSGEKGMTVVAQWEYEFRREAQKSASVLLNPTETVIWSGVGVEKKTPAERLKADSEHVRKELDSILYNAEVEYSRYYHSLLKNCLRRTESKKRLKGKRIESQPAIGAFNPDADNPDIKGVEWYEDLKIPELNRKQLYSSIRKCRGLLSDSCSLGIAFFNDCNTAIDSLYSNSSTFMSTLRVVNTKEDADKYDALDIRFEKLNKDKDKALASRLGELKDKINQKIQKYS